MKSLEKNFLNLKALQNLVEGRTNYVVINNYFDTLISQKLSRGILNNDQIRNCPHEIREGKSIKYIDYGVDAIGESYNITYGKDKNDENFLKYYEKAQATRNFIKSLLGNFLNPFDKLRLELDEIWPQRVNLANFDDYKKQAAGIVRIVRAGKNHPVSVKPHIDNLPEEKAVIKVQIAANLYLRVPKTGGELEIWENQLSNTPTIIKPSVGDLILFNSRKPHAIRSFSRGKRITLQCFIGVHQNNNFSLWA